MPERIDSLSDLCQELITERQRPLLVLYYPDADGTIRESDVGGAYSELRAAGLRKEEKIAKLDVLIHSTGGEPVAAYRLAQTLREFTDNLVFLVPDYAYSAGTLMCFAGDQIRFGDYARLSPIDITMGQVELASIDHFLNFAELAREKIEKRLQKIGSKNNSSVRTTHQ